MAVTPTADCSPTNVSEQSQRRNYAPVSSAIVAHVAGGRFEGEDRERVLREIAYRSRQARLAAGADRHELVAEITDAFWHRMAQRFRHLLMMCVAAYIEPAAYKEPPVLVDRLVDDLVDAANAPSLVRVASVAA